MTSTMLWAGDDKSKDRAKKTHCSYTGKVLDAENAEALTGATVKIVELDQTVYVDFNGNFLIENVPVGTYTLEVSFISYETKTIENFEIRTDSKSRQLFL